LRGGFVNPFTPRALKFRGFSLVELRLFFDKRDETEYTFHRLPLGR
jgi:hypothetical protein